MTTNLPDIRHGSMRSPIGSVLLITAEGALVGLYLDEDGESSRIEAGWREGGEAIDEARRQLEEYFAGERTEFGLEVRAAGTPFQQTVWAALRGIPFGETTSYGEIARRVGRPNASRAVGLANGRNPVSIVIPCHRVIGASGALTGYGWGVERKAWLLDHERDEARLFA